MTLEAAITAGNEFLQLRNHATRPQSGTALRVVDEPEEEPKPAQAEPVRRLDSGVLTTLTQTVQLLMERLEQMDQAAEIPSRPKQSRPTNQNGTGQKKAGCWG